MDTKKKTDDPYAPDKEARKERVVVGLSGGLDSFVTAYLLKIQKYELFAVTIAPTWEGFAGDKSSTLSCFVDDKKMEVIKEFCHQLKIPHYVIKPSSEFQDTVVEEWAASKITGTLSNACWSCHGLRLRALYNKMKELDAKFVATGHYAKLFHHTAHGTYYVHSSNDEEHDQSALLSRLPNEILSALMLPLSDLQKKEVIKLSKNFGLTLPEKLLNMHSCFPQNDETSGYLKQKCPKAMLVPGEVSNEGFTEMYGDHKGIETHTYGEIFEIEGALKRQELYMSRFSYKDKKIILSTAEFFERERIHLIDCHFSDDVSWTEPMKAVIELPGHNQVDCWIYPKMNNGALVELEGKHSVKENLLVPVYKKKGRNSKVYLTGKIRFLPKIVVEEANSRDGKEVKKIDYAKDF